MSMLTSLLAPGNGTSSSSLSEAFGPLAAVLDAGGTSAGLQVIGDSTGSDVNEWVYLLAEDLAAAFPNYGVRYRVWNDGTSDYGAPTEIQAPPSGERHVTLNGGAGSFLYLAHDSSQSITGDLDVSAKVALDDWTPAADQCICAKFGNSGARAWRFYVNSTGRLVLQWSTDGATGLPTATSTASPTVTDGAALWVRATLDVDNGSGAYVATFYTGTDGHTWTQLGSTVTAATTTSIFNASQQMEIGTRSTGSDLLAGDVYEVRIRNGIGGKLVVPANPEVWRVSSGTITTGGSPMLHVLNGSMSGANISTLNDATRLPKMTPDYGTLVTFLSNSHNDGAWLGASYLAQLDTWLTTVRSRQPLTVPIVVGQNPRTAPANYIGQHATRLRHQQSWAFRNDAGFADVYAAFNAGSLAALVDADGIHPTTAGSELWKGTLLAAFNAAA